MRLVLLRLVSWHGVCSICRYEIGGSWLQLLWGSTNSCSGSECNWHLQGVLQATLMVVLRAVLRVVLRIDLRAIIDCGVGGRVGWGVEVGSRGAPTFASFSGRRLPSSVI